MDPYHQKSEEWRRSMDEKLKKEDSWLALAGLFWLEEGDNSIGTGSANHFVLPPGSGPDQIGAFILKDAIVKIQVLNDVDLLIGGENTKEALLEPDTAGSPTEIKLKNLTFMLIDREDGLGIRLWDNQREERNNFPGRRWFPIKEGYLIKGFYKSFEEGFKVVMSRKNGSDYLTQAEGEVTFQLDGRGVSMLAFEQEDGSLFTMFLDQTSGKECYAAGRYLVIDSPQDGVVEIDFNRAYNPPCAFTDFATCPVPPFQNRLDVTILAGERV
jgi:uncharacterized protein (DUF1684 family)